LGSAVTVVSEVGYGQMTVSRVAGGARVSRRTFYELFDDREDCFLTVFNEAVKSVSELVLAACADECGWEEQVRSGLAALLTFFDEQPGIASLLIVDALQAGSRVQERRAEILAQLAGELHREGATREIPPLTGEGLAGAVLGVIHTRLSAKQPGRMLDLLNPLMGMILLPYLGSAAAQRELKRPVLKHARATRTRTRTRRSLKEASPSSPLSSRGDPLAGLPMRVTGRTLMVVEAIDKLPGASNREVATAAGITDQGQISKLLARLERLGLIENTGHGHLSGEPNAWRLTPLGKRLTTQLSFNASISGSSSRLSAKESAEKL
jgi:AcrR family transcriptional regulator/DNA-binding MarR family transcriptional regulator